MRRCHDLGSLLESRRPSRRGPRGPQGSRQETGIAGDRHTPSDRESASGYAAGFTIVIPLLLGAALGYGLGLVVDQELLLMPLGAAAGLVLGFYAVYVR